MCIKCYNIQIFSVLIPYTIIIFAKLRNLLYFYHSVFRANINIQTDKWFLVDELIGQKSFHIGSLTHPRSGKPSQFAFSDDYTTLYEVKILK